MESYLQRRWGLACGGESYQQYRPGVERERCDIRIREVRRINVYLISLPFLTLLISAGSFKKPLFDEDGTKAIGIETVDGTQYFADKVVLAAGAWSPTLVDLEGQCCSKVRTLLSS